MNSTYNMMQAIGAGPIILKQAINRSNRNANNLLDKNYVNHLSRLKADGINNMGRNIIVSLNFDL